MTIQGDFGFKQKFNCRMPYAYLSSTIGGEETTPFQALVDTGAAVILITLERAAELMGKTEEAVKADDPHPPMISGVGGGTPGYRCQFDLWVKAQQNDYDAILIQGAQFYAVELDDILGYDALFGQKHGFQNLLFEHLHHSDPNQQYWRLTEL